jgi:hypothetical protein
MRYGKIQILSQTKSYCGCISWELAAEIPDIAKASEYEGGKIGFNKFFEGKIFDS